MKSRKHDRVITRARSRSKWAAVTAGAQQDVGPGSGGEIERLNAHIAELSAQVRRLELENDGLRHQLTKASEGAVVSDYDDCTAA
jgi:hypothetical protein